MKRQPQALALFMPCRKELNHHSFTGHVVYRLFSLYLFGFCLFSLFLPSICCLHSFLSLPHIHLKGVVHYVFTTSYFLCSSLPLFNAHSFLLAESVSHPSPTPLLSEMVWGQPAHVSSSPASACGLEIPPSHRFKLHVSWLEESECTYTQSPSCKMEHTLLYVYYSLHALHTNTKTHKRIAII